MRSKVVLVLVILAAFAAGVCAFPFVWAVGSISYEGKGEFVGRTTIMEAPGPPVAGGMDSRMTMTELGNLATNSRVLAGVAQTLCDLGMDSPTRTRVMQGLAVSPVKDTRILAIEVRMPEADDAKVGADVVAAEMKREYVRQAASGEHRGFRLETIDPAYVSPVRPPRAGVEVFKLLLSPNGGPLTGGVVGLALGLLIGTLRRARNERKLLSA